MTQGRTTKVKTNNVVVESGRPTMPSLVANDKFAKAEWKRVLPLLDGMGTLTKIDGTILANYVMAYSLWKQAHEEVQQNGIRIIARNGYDQENPSIKTIAAFGRFMRDCMFQLGMTPKARSELRTNAKPKGTSDKWNKTIPMAS